MKQIIIIFTILILMMSSVALCAENAFDKGSVRVGGSFIYHRTNGEAYPDATTLRITPSTSFALSDRFFLGINTHIEHIDFNNSRYYRNYGYNPNGTNWSVGPIIEYYAVPNNSLSDGSKLFVPYMRLFVTLGTIEDYDFRKLGINIGVLQMLNKHIGIDFGVSYSWDKITQANYYYDYYYEYPNSYYYLEDNEGQKLSIGFGLQSFIF